VGVNLFPDVKRCFFDCPYCEVFPFDEAPAFSLERMEAGFPPVIDEAVKQGIAVRDICFSGNGEPTLSPHFSQAVESAARIRDTKAPGADIVVITNGTGLLRGDVFEFLRHAAKAMALKIWLKLDAGTEDWYRRMNCSDVPFETLTGKIKEFAGRAPLIIQTMVCSINGKPPAEAETAAWEKLVLELAGAGVEPGAGVRGVQIYGKARPAPLDPLAEALPAAYLESRAASLRALLATRGFSPLLEEAIIPVEVFP
jgi:histidinol dehydrogenase